MNEQEIQVEVGLFMQCIPENPSWSKAYSAFKFMEARSLGEEFIDALAPLIEQDVEYELRKINSFYSNNWDVEKWLEMYYGK